MNTLNENVLALVRSLGEQGFWGNLTLKFQGGTVVHITKEESIQTVPNQRSSHDNHSRRG